MVVFQLALQRAQLNLQEVIRGISSLYEDSLFISGLFEFLNTAPPEGRGLENITDREVPPVAPEVAFQGVSFYYPGMDKKILENISFRIPAGKVVALVGENGSGKTTIVKLLNRLYQPDAGKILLDALVLPFSAKNKSKTESR